MRLLHPQLLFANDGVHLGSWVVVYSLTERVYAPAS